MAPTSITCRRPAQGDLGQLWPSQRPLMSTQIQPSGLWALGLTSKLFSTAKSRLRRFLFYSSSSSSDFGLAWQPKGRLGSDLHLFEDGLRHMAEAVVKPSRLRFIFLTYCGPRGVAQSGNVQNLAHWGIRKLRLKVSAFSHPTLAPIVYLHSQRHFRMESLLWHQPSKKNAPLTHY